MRLLINYLTNKEFVSALRFPTTPSKYSVNAQTSPRIYFGVTYFGQVFLLLLVTLKRVQGDCRTSINVHRNGLMNKKTPIYPQVITTINI